MTPDTGGPEQKSGKSRDAFRTISEVAEHLDLPQHVLRFWESKFAQIKPLKRGGNRRYHRPEDVTLLSAIKRLLHTEGYTIRGVQKLFKAQGVKATIALAMGEPDRTVETPVVADKSLKEDASPFGGAPVASALAIPVVQLRPILARLKSMRTSLA